MIVEMTDIVKRYKELVALDHFNLEVAQGEIFGLLGPNGCGKTTAINCMLSLTQYESGTVELFGQPMSGDQFELKRRIGLVMQDIGVYETLTVQENIDYFCGLYISDRKMRQDYVNQAIEFVGLDKFRKFKPDKLSGGLKRRLNLACGVAHKPDLIILDEPTVQVDSQSRNHIMQGIELLAQEGKTIIYTTHYMEEVERLCDRLLIMDHGKILVSGTSEEIKKMSSSGEIVTVEIFEMVEEFQEALHSLPNVQSFDYQQGKLNVHFSKGQSNLIGLIQLIEEYKLNMLNISVQKPNLNDVFLEITGKELRDNA